MDGASDDAASSRLFKARYQDQPVRFAWMERKIAGPAGTRSARVLVGQTSARDALAARVLWRGTLALLGFTAAALALAGGACAVRWRRSAASSASWRARRVRPATHQGARAGRAGHAGAYTGRLHGAAGGKPDTLRLFIAEAAHQLRTLAALHAQMEVALDEEDPAEQRRSLLAVLRNAEKLSRLVNQLLSDASVIHRSNVRQFQPLDLAELLDQAVYDSVPQARARRAPGPAHRRRARAGPGDSLMLREAFKNLIDNALRHGAAPGHIDVRLERDGARWRVTVSDQGPGIPPALAHAAFERFVRGPNPRSAGAGLGLSIVPRGRQPPRRAATEQPRGRRLDAVICCRR